MRALELKIPPAVVCLVAGTLMWGVSSAGPAWALSLPWLRWCAVAAALTGGVTGAVGVLLFRRARTTINPARPGASTALVVSGIYRWTRNPMYLGLWFLLAGWALYLANALSFLILPAFVAYMNRFQIVPEERALAALFGAEFAAYKMRVRRWL